MLNGLASGAALLGALLLAGSAAAPAPFAPPRSSEEPVDFERDVAPLFEAHCSKCHGEAKQRAGLRLDSHAAVLAGSDDGEQRIVIPGEPGESMLYQLVTTTDEDERMPPKGGPLPPEEQELLRRWIAEGARSAADAAPVETETHWAYVPPRRPEYPATQIGWARNEIDIFVLRRLEGEGILPAPEADRATLARRAALDLTGLPPSLAELDAFLADDATDAFDRYVDRLLASPHYGERMARPWLDLARYADTNGYEKDDRRTMWRWRDWVIDAFNADMPFDEFTIRQLAGDLLPDATLEDRIATGFHRNTMVNAEGGVDPEEYRVAAVLDRVNTTSTVWLGTTMACVQCHAHKYDPFTQREYYQLFAYFNSTADAGPGVGPRIDAPTAEEREAEALAAAEEARLQARLTEWTPGLQAELVAFRGRGRFATNHDGFNDGSGVDGGDTNATVVVRPQRASAENGSTLTLDREANLVVASGELPAEDAYVLEFELTDAALKTLTLDVLTDEALEGDGPGRPSHGNFVLSEVTAELREGGATRALSFARALADHHQVGQPDWPPSGAIDGDPRTGWAVGGGTGRPHRLVLQLSEPLRAPGAMLVVRLDQQYGHQHLIARLRAQLTDQYPSGDNVVVPPDVAEWLTAFESFGPEDPRRAGLREWFNAHAPSLANERERLAELRARPKPPTALVMQELDEPRATHLLQRGSFLSPGDVVTHGVPSVLHEFPADAPPNRLGLARWLVAPENPLTARVTVNRLWEQVFGRGLVATSDDFGTQGEPPSHPDLLDWLALQLIEDGWSLKQTLRRIVTSATYRQSARVSPELLERDPDNVLLARSPRYRVEAEMVRDIALTASGLLSPQLGGPSVMPPQPEGIWNATYSGDRWRNAEDHDRYRRGLYTFWRRTSPYPSFATFDAPSRELVCARRNRSNTPLQALTLLNDPAYFEAAEALAARMRAEGGATDLERLAHGFRLCTSRRPNEVELDVLLELLEDQREVLDAFTPAEGATAPVDPLTLVANVLLNLDETVTRP